MVYHPTSPRSRILSSTRWWWLLPIVLLALIAALSWYGQATTQPHAERFAREVSTSGSGLALIRQTPLAQTYLRDFRTQEYASSCGPASLRNVLTSLDRPVAQERDLFQGNRGGWWRMRLMGMTLDEVATLAEATGMGRVQVRRDLTESDFRALLATLNAPGRRLILNFDRAPIHGVSLGHFSPVGGYDLASDRVLLLDVTPGYGVQLVPTALLHAAMQTRDPVSGRSRGLIQIDMARKPDASVAP